MSIMKILKDKEINDETLEKIVNIHLKVLSNDILPQFGKYFLKLFYRFIIKSKTEELFVLIDSEQNVISAIIISNSPNDILKRIIVSSFLYFIISLCIGIIRSKKLRKTVYSLLFSKNDYFVHKSPEIVYIFSNPKNISKGFGKRLIDYVFKTNSYDSLYVKTLNNKNNKALNFYKKNNFIKINEFNYADNQYLYMKKQNNV